MNVVCQDANSSLLKTTAATVCALPMYVGFLSGCISRYSAGSVYYYQSYHHKHNPVQVEKLQKELKRYLTRKIGFEAVMRIRCTKGLNSFLDLGRGWRGSGCLKTLLAASLLASRFHFTMDKTGDFAGLLFQWGLFL